MMIVCVVFGGLIRKHISNIMFNIDILYLYIYMKATDEYVLVLIYAQSAPSSSMTATCTYAS